MIVIMSDSHVESKIIEEIKNQYSQKAEVFIHCGDSELSSQSNIWEGVHVVAGNCDYDSGYAPMKIIKVKDLNILITHGHLQFVSPSRLGNLHELAREYSADIVCFGHIHRPIAEIQNQTLYLNPGSLSQPRGNWPDKMYLLLDIEESEEKRIFKLSYRTLDHKAIEDLQIKLEIKK
ncbi:MAG: metallophosphoesterase [Lactovum sp.]